ncbi:MAG: glycosidase [Phycisphaeraceae bacterium]|nr:glycosidase [Phycisphaeraceae bacterium]
MSIQDTSHPGITIARQDERFAAHSHKVIVRYFNAAPGERFEPFLRRFLALSTADKDQAWQETCALFDTRHKNSEAIYRRHYARVCSQVVQQCHTELLIELERLPTTHQLLLGAYFSLEYSFAAAAYFNPSIVAAPDQSGVPKGGCKFILSFRAVGEGHISSVAFRSGMLTADGDVQMEASSNFSSQPEIHTDALYEKILVLRKLKELGAAGNINRSVLEKLPEHFTRMEMEQAIAATCDEQHMKASDHRCVQTLRWLAESNYTVNFSCDSDISERILFPVSEVEKNGLEDARFVRFVEDDGNAWYYATYTAYDGSRIMPQLIETGDFLTYHIRSLNGTGAHGKGFALFPRRINGEYFMIGRQNGQDITISRSNHIHFWGDSELLQAPELPWDLVQLGNCGSPIETPEGWLLLTHGVGPMRRYVLGAILLDLEDPTKVIGHLREPLMAPDESEREGYVPNVLYSCGAMLHKNMLVLPYAMADSVSGIAVIDMPSLLKQMK